MLKSPKRRKLNLVRDRNIKVTNEDREYFFKEKAYCSRDDGFIDLEEISKEKFDAAKILEMQSIETDYKYAQLHIQRKIEEMERA